MQTGIGGLSVGTSKSKHSRRWTRVTCTGCQLLSAASGQSCAFKHPNWLHMNTHLQLFREKTCNPTLPQITQMAKSSYAMSARVSFYSQQVSLFNQFSCTPSRKCFPLTITKKKDPFWTPLLPQSSVAAVARNYCNHAVVNLWRLTNWKDKSESRFLKMSQNYYSKSNSKFFSVFYYVLLLSWRSLSRKIKAHDPE